VEFLFLCYLKLWIVVSHGQWDCVVIVSAAVWLVLSGELILPYGHMGANRQGLLVTQSRGEIVSMTKPEMGKCA